jgi:hypothetical protein
LQKKSKISLLPVCQAARRTCSQEDSPADLAGIVGFKTNGLRMKMVYNSEKHAMISSDR